MLIEIQIYSKLCFLNILDYRNDWKIIISVCEVEL